MILRAIEKAIENSFFSRSVNIQLCHRKPENLGAM